MRGFFVGVVVTLLVLAGGGFLVANRGWYPIGADNPPSTLEKQLANMATDAYMDSHAPNQENPVQPTAAALSDGARTFEMHCSLCHGGAAQRISPMRAKFNPPVPQIINRVPDRPGRELLLDRQARHSHDRHAELGRHPVRQGHLDRGRLHQALGQAAARGHESLEGSGRGPVGPGGAPESAAAGGRCFDTTRVQRIRPE